jgi:hypothetical protein
VVTHPLLVEVEEVLGHDCSFGSGGPRWSALIPTPRTATGESDTVVPAVLPAPWTPVHGARDALLREERDDACSVSEHSGIPLDGEEA